MTMQEARNILLQDIESGAVKIQEVLGVGENWVVAPDGKEQSGYYYLFEVGCENSDSGGFSDILAVTKDGQITMPVIGPGGAPDCLTADLNGEEENE